jgi:hypothetical protein
VLLPCEDSIVYEALFDKAAVEQGLPPQDARQQSVRDRPRGGEVRQGSCDVSWETRVWKLHFCGQVDMERSDEDVVVIALILRFDTIAAVAKVTV